MHKGAKMKAILRLVGFFGFFVRRKRLAVFRGSIRQSHLYGGAIHAAKTTKAVVTAMYEAAGTSTLYVDCPLEGVHRDIRAVTQHTVLWFMRLKDVGRLHLGLKPNNPLF
jgi:Acyl-CoA dehydrogenase, C-terminal domain